jgi:hypothetical protein
MNLSMKSRQARLSLPVRLAVGLFLSTALLLGFTQRFPEALPYHTTRLMSLVRGKGYFVRSFNPDGLPVSRIARLGKEIVTPFYVVHYGLIYSHRLAHDPALDYLWETDDTLGAWNVPPPPRLVTAANAIRAADWVLEHLRRGSEGKYHLYYDYEWTYPGTSQGRLTPPWYSGLTDAYALLLLARVHASTGREAYLTAAGNLYVSTIAPKEEGGSLVRLPDGSRWVEEYVARNNFRDPLVFNGMFYSTLGILEYERYRGIRDGLGPDLLRCIRANTARYDAGWWSYYDDLKNLNTYKYHMIHIAIARQLARMTGDPYYRACADRWQAYRPNYFTISFIRGVPTVNDWGVLVQCLFLVGLGAFAGASALGRWTRGRNDA